MKGWIKVLRATVSSWKDNNFLRTRNPNGDGGDVFGIFHNRTRICWTSITERIFLLQSVISLRHPGIRSKTKFDISVDDEARRRCEDRVGKGKSNNPYIGTEQFIGGDFVQDCIRFNRAIRLSSRISRLCGRLWDSRMIGEFKIRRREWARLRRARTRGVDNAPQFYSTTENPCVRRMAEVGTRSGTWIKDVKNKNNILSLFLTRIAWTRLRILLTLSEL